MKRIAILGSTGSIGRSTLSVVESYPDRFEVATLAAGSNVELALEQAVRWKPLVVSLGQTKPTPTPSERSSGSLASPKLKSSTAPPEPSALPPIPTSISWSAPS